MSARLLLSMELALERGGLGDENPLLTGKAEPFLLATLLRQAVGCITAFVKNT
jgi:hypothetical protein